MKKKQNNSIKIFLPITSMSSFVKKDIDILKSEFEVEIAYCNTFLSMFTNIRFIFKNDCIFCWFGSLRFFPVILAAKIFKKKIIIVSGGYDVASVPEIQYGNMYGIFSKYLGRLLFYMADKVTSVSLLNIEETKKNAKVPDHKIRLIYHGFEDVVDNSKINFTKEKLVLTVGYIDMCTIYRKGFLTFIKISKLLPDIPFIIIGSGSDEALDILKKNAGKNIIFTGFVSKEELHSNFLKAKIYLQPSIHEAFGCSVAEAMLYNCIPVVSDKGALSEVIGESGICLDVNNIEESAYIIRKILNDNIKFQVEPRKRVLSKFPISKRHDLLLNLIDEVCIEQNNGN